MGDEIKIIDYYFFGVGTVSLVSTFFLINEIFEFYYLFVLFFFTNFLVSLFLNMKLFRKLQDIYIVNQDKYILNHLILAFLSSLMTVALFFFIKDVVLFISYFLLIDFFIMAAVLLILIRKRDLIQ